MIWFIGRNVETVYHIYQGESQYFPSYSVFCFEVVFYAWESTHFANWQLCFLYPIYPIIAKWTLIYYTWTLLCFDDKALQFSLVTLIYAGYGNAHLYFQNPKVISTGLCDMHSKFQVSIDCMRSYLRKLFIIVCAWCVCGHARALSMGIHMYLPLCIYGGLREKFLIGSLSTMGSWGSVKVIRVMRQTLLSTEICPRLKTLCSQLPSRQSINTITWHWNLSEPLFPLFLFLFHTIHFLSMNECTYLGIKEVLKFQNIY